MDNNEKYVLFLPTVLLKNTLVYWSKNKVFLSIEVF